MTGERFYLRPPIPPGTGRFHAGDTFDLEGFQLRLVAGTKAFDGLRMDVRCPQWTSLRLHEVGLIVDFLYENEHMLFPPARGHLGGEKVMQHLNLAVQRGWRSAAAVLDEEKERAARRRRAS